MKWALLLAPVSDASPSAPGLFTAKEPLTRVQPYSFTFDRGETVEGQHRGCATE